MRPISPKVKQALLNEKQECYRKNEGTCKGRLTLDHVWIYAGRQIDEHWAILWTCAFHHDVDQFQGGGNLDRDLSKYVSLKKATTQDLAKYPKKDWQQEIKRLKEKYEKIT